jgi:hypothetical protein
MNHRRVWVGFVVAFGLTLAVYAASVFVWAHTSGWWCSVWCGLLSFGRTTSPTAGVEGGVSNWTPWVLVWFDWEITPTWWKVGVPIWLPTLLFGVGVLALRPRRARMGHCRCGYDLNGLNGGVCPECGRAVRGAAT